LLFFRSTNYKNRKFLTRYTNAASPAADEPTLFHSAWRDTNPGQCISAMLTISNPSLSMLLPFIYKCNKLGWYCGMSWASTYAPSLPMMRSLRTNLSLPA